MAKKSKKGGASGQRGKKKHEKELKRRHKLAAPASARRVRKRDWRPLKEGIEGLSARLRVHYHVVAHELTEYSSLPLDELPGGVWTVPRIAALATSELLARLGAVGIATTEDAFLAATEQERSALRFARRAWLPLLPRASSVHDRDLALLGACALWQRLRPAAPSIEGILDPYLAAIDHELAHEMEAALDAWLVFFDRLRPRLTPAVRTIEDLEALLDHAVDDIEDWTQNLFVLAHELTSPSPALCRRVAELLGALADQLSGESEDWRLCLRDDQARLLARSGNKAEGAQVLRAVIAKDPANLDTYFTLAAFLTDDESEDRAELTAAIGALEMGKAIARDPKDLFGFNERIAELREHLAELGEDADSA